MTDTALVLVRHQLEPAPTAGRLEVIAAGFLSGYHGATRTAYARDLRLFAQWATDQGLDPLTATRAHVQLYARVPEGQGRAPATVARPLSALAGFYRYALDEGYLDRSPLAHIRRPRVSDESPRFGLDKTEMIGLLDVAERAGTLEHSLIALLCLNGLRISEACGADVTDLGAQRGHRTLAILRKGGKRAVAPLAPRTAAAVDAHVADRRIGPLLLTAAGTRLDRKSGWRIFRRLAGQVTAKTVSPHSARHGFVTLALDAGVPLHRVQDAAGHADPRTTLRYDRARHALDDHATYTLAEQLAA